MEKLEVFADSLVRPASLFVHFSSYLFRAKYLKKGGVSESRAEPEVKNRWFGWFDASISSLLLSFFPALFSSLSVFFHFVRRSLSICFCFLANGKFFIFTQLYGSTIFVQETKGLLGIFKTSLWLSLPFSSKHAFDGTHHAPKSRQKNARIRLLWSCEDRLQSLHHTFFFLLSSFHFRLPILVRPQ